MSSITNVDVSTIRPEACFATRFAGDFRQLQSSIRTYGILHAPRLYVTEGQTKILDGLERVKIAGELGLEEIACYVYDEEQLSRANAFLLCLELNRLSRRFNLVEKALWLREAFNLFSGAGIPRSFWTTTEIPHNIRAVQQHKDLLRLPMTVLKYAVNNNMSLSTVLSFINFKPEDIEKLASQLFILPLNQNKLAEILSLLQDISKKENRSVFAILEEIMPELELEFSPHQKEEKLRHLLQQRRNPHYEKRLADFEGRVKKLPLNDMTRVRPAPFFEEDYIEITTRFYSQEDVNDFIESLKHESWNNVLTVHKV